MKNQSPPQPRPTKEHASLQNSKDHNIDPSKLKRVPAGPLNLQKYLQQGEDFERVPLSLLGDPGRARLVLRDWEIGWKEASR